MKKKSFWGSLKGRLVKDLREVGDVREKKEWIRNQFAELSRLGNCPIVMKMGN